MRATHSAISLILALQCASGAGCASLAWNGELPTGVGAAGQAASESVAPAETAPPEAAAPKAAAPKAAASAETSDKAQPEADSAPTASPGSAVAKAALPKEKFGSESAGGEAIDPDLAPLFQRQVAALQQYTQQQPVVGGVTQAAKVASGAEPDETEATASAAVPLESSAAAAVNATPAATPAAGSAPSAPSPPTPIELPAQSRPAEEERDEGDASDADLAEGEPALSSGTSRPVTIGAATIEGTPGQAVALASATTPEAPPAAARWTASLRDAISALEEQLETADQVPPNERRRLHAYLRLLYTVADRRSDALEPIEVAEAAEQEYWKNQLHSLLVTLDDQGTPVESRRAALALRHLREAAAQLGTVSTLDVRNLAFCSQVDSYGRYSEFPKYEFRPNQEVLLYVEVDNFTSERKEGGTTTEGRVRPSPGYETELQGSYEVLDMSGRRVTLHELPRDKQICRNRRRDYFIAYHVYMPRNIDPGEYRLQLTMEDVKGQKFGQAAVDFRIR